MKSKGYLALIMIVTGFAICFAVLFVSEKKKSAAFTEAYRQVVREDYKCFVKAFRAGVQEYQDGKIDQAKALLYDSSCNAEFYLNLAKNRTMKITSDSEMMQCTVVLSDTWWNYSLYIGDVFDGKTEDAGLKLAKLADWLEKNSDPFLQKDREFADELRAIFGDRFSDSR